MKVKELIEVLQEMNEEDYVFLTTQNNNLRLLKEVKLDSYNLFNNNVESLGRVVILEAEK